MSENLEETKDPTPTEIYSGKILIFCIGIPGMGKSTLIPVLTQVFAAYDYTMSVVSSDSIRKE
jgi:putative protein kinase ArgK-like GTPase of G3E family